MWIPYITNGRVIVQSRVLDDEAEIEGDNFMRDGRELVVETETVDTSDVSVPRELSSSFPLDSVNRLVARRCNWRIDVKIATFRHLRFKQRQFSQFQ